MKYTKIIIALFASLGIIFCARFPFPALSENALWISLCLFLFQLLLITVILKLLFEFILKEYLKTSYKKASIVAYIITIIYCLLDSAKHYFFSDSEVFTIPIIPLFAPAVVFSLFYFLNKEMPITKKQKIIFISVLIIIFAYSAFCEGQIVFNLINQAK